MWEWVLRRHWAVTCDNLTLSESEEKCLIPRCIAVCCPTATDGHCGGTLQTERQGTAQTRCDTNNTTLCLWARLWLKFFRCGGSHWAERHGHSLVWKISAISASASGLTRTHGAAEPGKGDSFVWLPISIKQQRGGDSWSTVRGCSLQCEGTQKRSRFKV